MIFPREVFVHVYFTFFPCIFINPNQSSFFFFGSYARAYVHVQVAKAKVQLDNNVRFK